MIFALKHIFTHRVCPGCGRRRPWHHVDVVLRHCLACASESKPEGDGQR